MCRQRHTALSALARVSACLHAGFCPKFGSGQRTGAMTRVDWKSFFCKVIPMYYSYSIIFRIRDMWLNLPLHSVRPCGPRSRQIWSSFIVGKSVFATFFCLFSEIVRFIRKLVNARSWNVNFMKFELIFELFKRRFFCQGPAIISNLASN